MKKVCFFTVADENNLKYYEKLKNSLKKFHPDIPLILIGPDRLNQMRVPEKFYLMTPMIARDLIKEYELVIKLDADQVITGSLQHVIDDTSYDMGNVCNWNRVDPQKFNFPLTVWDIPVTTYMNCGFVALRNQELIEHWWLLCNAPNFRNYRFREQDLMNIIYYYGNYNVKCFDYSNKWHGLISKGEWLNLKLKGDKIILPSIKGYPDEEKEIVCIHWAEGNKPNKMAFDTQFPPDVAKRLKELTEENGTKTTAKKKVENPLE